MQTQIFYHTICLFEPDHQNYLFFFQVSIINFLSPIY